MRSVLYDVYERLPVSRWTKFFTLDEKNWSDYLQRQDAFSPKAHAELQHQQRVTLNILLKEERKAAMKRFLAVLLAMVIFAVLFFSIGGIVSVCTGAEPLRLTISEPLPLPPTPYPSEVYSMTDAEFFKWATDQNDKARAEWDEWYKTAPRRWTSYDGTTIDGHGQSPRYRDRMTVTPRGVKSSSASGGRYYYHQTRQSFQRRYLNPDYVSRPLTIINPYCRPQPAQ